MALMAYGNSYAYTLSPESALSRFLHFDGRRMPASTSSASALSLMETVSTIDSTLPAYYVFSDELHSYLLGADSRVAPLLAVFDKTVDFQSLAPHVEWFLQSYRKEISMTICNNDFEGEDSDFEERVIYDEIDSHRSPVTPLLSTTWNQDYPYNMLCPVSGGINCVTGCVATAMAQVLAYYQWPVSGRGYVDNAAGLYDFESSSFNWPEVHDSYMPDDSDSSWSERLAVAELMYSCGVAVNMIYSASVSGAYTMRIADALRDNFRYTPSICYKVRDVYGRLEWEDMLYRELAEGRPVLYGGRGTAGGHSFVCDGYLSRGLFHFNWGWGGVYDGYFRISAMNPMGVGIGGGSGQFNSDQDAIIGIYPDYEDSASIASSPVFSTGGFTPGSNISNKGDRFDVEFTIERGAIINPSGIGRSGNLGVFLCDFKSEPKWIPMTETSFAPIADDGTMTPKTRYKGSVYYSSLPAGSYIIFPGFCQQDGTPERIRVCDATSQVLNLTITDDGKASLLPDFVGVIPDVYVTRMEVEESYDEGQEREARITFVCGDTKYEGELYLTASPTDESGEFVIGSIVVSQEAGSVRTYGIPFDDSLCAGSMRLRVRDSLWISSGATTIFESEPSSINVVNVGSVSAEDYVWYSIDGRRIRDPRNYDGIMIRSKSKSSAVYLRN